MNFSPYIMNFSPPHSLSFSCLIFISGYHGGLLSQLFLGLPRLLIFLPSLLLLFHFPLKVLGAPLRLAALAFLVLELRLLLRQLIFHFSLPFLGLLELAAVALWHGIRLGRLLRRGRWRGCFGLPRGGRLALTDLSFQHLDLLRKIWDGWLE